MDREKHNAYVRLWNKNNRDKKSLSDRKWVDANREKYMQNKKIWRAMNKEKCMNYAKKSRLLYKDRWRNYRLKNVYGITLDQYNELFKKQEGKCGVCGKHQNEINKPLSVEHCHKTDIVRGLVCQRCNIAISVLENKDICLKVTLFLERSR